MRKLEVIFRKAVKIFSSHKVILLIVVLAAFLRLYKIGELTIFLGEQGRDFLIAKEILRGKLTLLGPPTSISEVHFGPFYHYFNALFLFLFRLDPLGPAVGFSLLSLASVFFLYRLATDFGHQKAGYFAAFLMAISPWMVEYGRTAFNSFFVTSFAVFSIWALAQYLKNYQKFKIKTFASTDIFLLLGGLFAGLALQANFLSFGLIVGLVLFFLWGKFPLKKQLWFLGGVLVAVFPYLLFEVRHQFFNTKAFWALLSSGKAVSFSFFVFIKKIIFGFWQAVDFALGFGYPRWLSLTFTIVLGVSLVLFFVFNRRNQLIRLITIFLLAKLMVTAVYPGPMLVHYLGAIYPFVFLLAGLVIEKLASIKIKYLAVLAMIGLTFLNLKTLIQRDSWREGMPPGWDLDGVKKAGKIISQDAQGNFNVAAILDGDTRAYPYRYIIETASKKPLGVEEYPRADVLYVIARGEAEGVLSYPVWEINTILPARITKIWPVKNNISVFKLERL